MLPDPPPTEVLQAFGVEEPARRLTGGQGTAWIAGDLVLKPEGGPVHEWLGMALADLQPDGVRLSLPVPTRDRAWVCDGWSATRWVEGDEPDYSAASTWIDIVEAGRAFHRAVAHLARPDCLDTRTDRWAMADRAVWGESSMHFRLEFASLARQLNRAVEPLGDPQVVHGDLTHNVLFTPGLAPAVIDVSPYWRPPEHAEGVVLADALCGTVRRRGCWSRPAYRSQPWPAPCCSGWRRRLKQWRPASAVWTCGMSFGASSTQPRPSVSDQDGRTPHAASPWRGTRSATRPHPIQRCGRALGGVRGRSLATCLKCRRDGEGRAAVCRASPVAPVPVMAGVWPRKVRGQSQGRPVPLSSECRSGVVLQWPGGAALRILQAWPGLIPTTTASDASWCATIAMTPIGTSADTSSWPRADTEREYKACMEEAAAKLRARRDRGELADPAEYVTGHEMEPGYRRKQQDARLAEQARSAQTPAPLSGG